MLNKVLENDRYFTPLKYLPAIRNVLGTIDLDPASCKEANDRIKANSYFDETTDGLAQSWFGNVFLNPPYSRGNLNLWIPKLISEYEIKNIKSSILLVQNQTSEKWFQPLFNYPICFTDHRIWFVLDGKLKKDLKSGNAFVYFGKNIKTFYREFQQFGRVVVDLDYIN